MTPRVPPASDVVDGAKGQDEIELRADGELVSGKPAKAGGGGQSKDHPER